MTTRYKVFPDGDDLMIVEPCGDDRLAETLLLLPYAFLGAVRFERADDLRRRRQPPGRVGEAAAATLILLAAVARTWLIATDLRHRSNGPVMRMSSLSWCQAYIERPRSAQSRHRCHALTTCSFHSICANRSVAERWPLSVNKSRHALGLTGRAPLVSIDVAEHVPLGDWRSRWHRRGPRRTRPPSACFWIVAWQRRPPPPCTSPKSGKGTHLT